MLLRRMCSHMVLLTQFYHHCAFQTPIRKKIIYLENDILRNARATGRRNTTPEPQNMTEGQISTEEDVAPGKTIFGETTEHKVLCIEYTNMCPLASDTRLRRPVTELCEARCLRCTVQFTG